MIQVTPAAARELQGMLAKGSAEPHTGLLVTAAPLYQRGGARAGPAAGA